MRVLIIGTAGIVLAALLWALFGHAPQSDSTVSGHVEYGHATTTASESELGTDVQPQSGSIVRIGGTDVRVVVADTPATRVQGLSGTDFLAEGEGMLFMFPEEAQYGFWMKDMNFSIDIIWLSREWVVVDMAENVSPESYPTSFSPSKPALYVLEVPAGFAKSHNIAVGAEAAFLR